MYNKKNYERNKEKILASNRKTGEKWRNKNRNFKRRMDKDYRERKYYDGKRNLVLERDNWQCTNCEMSQEQHIILFNRGLVIHHLDGQGYYSKEKNNDLSNMTAVCLRCHPKVDAEMLRSQFPKGSNRNPITQERRHKTK